MTDKQKLKEIHDIVIEYVSIDGAHHKQYALEQICDMLNIELEEHTGIPD